jgi:hypothetical protein
VTDRRHPLDDHRSSSEVIGRRRFCSATADRHSSARVLGATEWRRFLTRGFRKRVAPLTPRIRFPVGPPCYSAVPFLIHSHDPFDSFRCVPPINFSTVWIAQAGSVSAEGRVVTLDMSGVYESKLYLEDMTIYSVRQQYGYQRAKRHYRSRSGRAVDRSEGVSSLTAVEGVESREHASRQCPCCVLIIPQNGRFSV